MRSKDAQARARRWRLATGRCYECKRLATHDTVRCDYHRAKHNRRCRERYLHLQADAKAAQ